MTKTPYNPPDEELYYDWVDHKGIPQHANFTDKMLAKLLIDDVLFVGDFNSGPFFTNETQDKSTACVWVNCNDVFSWGCADVENLPESEIPALFAECKKDPKWGSTKWCAKKRNQQPQKPIIEQMKKEGVWDEEMENLGKNNE